VDDGSIQSGCGENFMELNVKKTKIISFPRKINRIHYNYYVSEVSALLAVQTIMTSRQ
jgi:hypothetical protein